MPAMRRRWLIRFMIVLAMVAVLAAGLTWYLNTVILPGPARQWIGAWLAEQTGRRIQLGRLSFRIWDGISIDQVIVFEDPRYGNQPFLECDRITFSCVYLPFLTPRRVIIPTVRLMRPRLHLIRDAGGAWSMMSLRALRPPAPRHSAGPAAPPSVAVVLAKLVILDGTALVDDQQHSPGLNAVFTRLDLRAALALPHLVSVTGTAQWQTTPVTPLLLRGRWDLRERIGQIALTARQCPLDTLRPYLPPRLAETVQDLAGSAAITVKAQIRPPDARVTATVATSGCRWQWQGVQGTGDVTLVGHTAWRAGRPWSWDGVTASGRLHELTLRAPARSLTIEQLAGTIRASARGLEAPVLTARINGLPVHGRVALTPHPSSGWQRPRLAATAQTDAPLEALWQAAAPYRPRGWADAALEGSGHCTVTAQGSPHAPQISATLQMEDGRLTHPAIGALEHLRGRVRLEPNLVTVTGMTGHWRDAPVQLDGTLVNFAAPEIDAAVRWGEVAAEAALAIEGRRMTITNLVTTYRHSRAQTTGEITVETLQPEGTLYSEFALDLTDLPALAPWQLGGVVKGRAFLKGPLTSPHAWELGIKAHAGSLAVRGLTFENVHGEYQQRGPEAAVPTLTARCYGGVLSASGTVQWLPSQRPFTAQMAVANTELGRLAADTPWRQHQLAGLLSGEWSLRGNAQALPQTLDGHGRLQVTNGRLFELPLLKGLADLLGAPALRRVTFREAAGTFAVNRGVLSTSDLTFYGDLTTLTATGTVGPAGALDARIIVSIDPTAFEQSPQFAKAAGQFLYQAGYLIGEVKVGGTLDHPTHEIVPVTLNRILKEQVFERLRGLVQGIWQ